jgi:peptidoglycan hydrolase CwlO-like protein
VEETNFTDLRDIVAALAQAQVRTEARVEELAQAQARTEARLETLTTRVDTLAVRMEELAQAQLRTENEVTHLRRTVETQLGGLGHAGGYKLRRLSETL